MFSRLRENLLYKVLALVCAAIIHFYVVGQVNPRQSRSLTLPLTAANINNIPPGLLVDEKSLPSVTIALDGPTDEISHLTESSVTPTVDMNGGHIGKNSGIRVRVELPPDLRSDVTTDIQPHMVSIVLTPQRKRLLPVTASYPGAPPAGYAYRAPIVMPREATVSGNEDMVNAVSQLVVKVGGAGAVGTVDDDYAIVPLDSEGNEVSDVAITPQMAHVRIGIVKAPAMRSLIVSPTVVGSSPFPYKIAEVKATPSSVLVSGLPALLAATGTINTEPVDVAGATADVTRDVSLAPSEGLTLVKPIMVRVTVHIVTEQPGAPPANTPAAKP